MTGIIIESHQFPAKVDHGPTTADHIGTAPTDAPTGCFQYNSLMNQLK